MNKITSEFPAKEAQLSLISDPVYNTTQHRPRVLPAASLWQNLWLIEDDRNVFSKRGGRTAQDEVVVTLHQVRSEGANVHASQSLSRAQASVSGTCLRTALALVNRPQTGESGSVVVSNTAYGCNPSFLRAVQDAGRFFAVELKATTIVSYRGQSGRIQDHTKDGEWRDTGIIHPFSRVKQPCLVMRLRDVSFGGVKGDVLIAQVGGVTIDVHRSTLFGFTNQTAVSNEELLCAVRWVHLVRLAVRRTRKTQDSTSPTPAETSCQEPLAGLEDEAAKLAVAKLSTRPNNTFVNSSIFPEPKEWTSRQLLSRSVNLVELFAGAGGMGLGFLQAKSPKQVNLLFSGELEPIYAQTLRLNHEVWRCQQKRKVGLPVDSEPVDLTTPESFERIQAAIKSQGDIGVVVGGPPCQGFSSANRNSGSSSNPNNQLVDVFLRHVEALNPRVFLMENVQGIVWTNSQGRTWSVAQDLQIRLERAGYLIFPHLLDATWFGVPQHRMRFFLLGIHMDTGYRRSDFGEFGPFPDPTHGSPTGLPLVTVREAIEDLPPIGNGQSQESLPYSELKAQNAYLRQMREFAPYDEITDHVTSRHADYVLKRYEAIPEGGNWQDIKEMMTNYADIGRTHSNIYRRLAWASPSITMGHYRKSMLIHPSQDRGLSLREAMRLQSFPDWYRFAGSPQGTGRGLAHKQQQLANAVCPLLLQAIAEQILKL